MVPHVFEPFKFYYMLNNETICACLVAYAGFLKGSELFALKRSDIFICASHMLVVIEHCKSDIFHDCAWVLIARTGTDFSGECSTLF